MYRAIYLNIFLFLFLSCINSQKQQDEKSLRSRIVEEAKSPIKKEIDTNEIFGIWAEDKDANALFEIKGDSIYYFEHPDESVSYEIKSDTFMIYYDDLTTKNVIMKLNQDSFVFKTELGHMNKLYKR